MKSILEIKKVYVRKRRVAEEESKVVWKRKPQEVDKAPRNPYDGLCRILPSFVKDNFEYFELLSMPKKLIVDRKGYILRLKKKIACMKSEILL